MKRKILVGVSLLVSGLIPLFSWEGKVFDVSGKKVTVASSQTSGVRAGTRLYILKDGKEVGQGRVGNVFHTKVEMTLVSGVAEKGLVVTDKPPVPTSVSVAKPGMTDETRKKIHAELFKACYDGDLEGVKRALKSGADINYIDEGRNTAIGQAAGGGRGGGQLHIVKYLISKGANVNVPANLAGTPLLQTCPGVICRLDIMKILLAAKADPNGDGKYYSPLMAAAAGGHIEAVKMLIAAGANVNARTANDITPLNQAKSNPEITELLKAAGAKE